MLNMVAGFMMAVLSAVLFGAAAVVTKMISNQGVAVSSILLFRGLIGGGLLVGVSRLRGNDIRGMEKQMRKKALILSVFGSGATLLMLNKAYLYLPVGSVTTIHYLFPAIVNIIGARMSKKRLSFGTKAVLFICLAGTVLLFDSLTRSQFPGVVYAVLSIATWSFQLLYLEHSGLTACPASAVAVWQCMTVAAMGLICGTVEGHTFAKAVNALPLLFLAALMNNVLANILLQAGVKRIGGGLAAILCIFEPVSSIIFGCLLLGENMTGRQILAVTVILAAIGILIIINGRKERNMA